MNQNTITGDIIGVTLRQLGAAKIREFSSHMHIVDFVLENGLEVSYVFNITKNDKYFLQRMKPYAIPHGKFSNDKEIVEFIKEDITKFRNASHSSNFKKFLEISEKGNDLVYTMESLFLNHNVDQVLLTRVESAMNEIIKDIEKHKENAEVIPIVVEDVPL